MTAGSMQGRWWALGGVALLLLCGCHTRMKVDTGFGRGANCTRWGTTFAWWPQKAVGGEDRRALDPAFDQFLRQTIADRLVARGYKLQAGEPADLLVDYRIEPKPCHGSKWAAMYEKGTLIIDIYDGPTHRHIWRGSAGTHIKRCDEPEEQECKAWVGAHRVLTRFPKAAAD